MSSWEDTNIDIFRFQKQTSEYPKFQKPVPVSCFTTSTDRSYVPRADKMHYYKKPTKFPLDLNENIRNAIPRPESTHHEGLMNIFKHIENEITVNKENPLLGVDFVCWRGLLTLIMGTPFDHKTDWQLRVTQFMGTCYIRSVETKQRKMERDTMTPKQCDMASWGYKFEQYCLAETVESEPDTISPVDECSEFAMVYQANMGDFNMYYGAEMDGVDSNETIIFDARPTKQQLKSLNFVELKVRKKDLHYGQQRTYNSLKSRKWWCQAFLVGIPKIIVGMRNDSGFVHSIEEVDVQSLVHQGQNYWSGYDCFEFLKFFLKFVKEKMGDLNCPYTVVDFFYNSNNRVIIYKKTEGKSPVSFLPDCYIPLIKSQYASTFETHTEC